MRFSSLVLRYLSAWVDWTLAHCMAGEQTALLQASMKVNTHTCALYLKGGLHFCRALCEGAA